MSHLNCFRNLLLMTSLAALLLTNVINHLLNPVLSSLVYEIPDLYNILPTFIVFKNLVLDGFFDLGALKQAQNGPALNLL